MSYATIVVEIPASSTPSRQAWQTLRDDIFGSAAKTEGEKRLAENCVSLDLSTDLATFAKVVHHCASCDLRYSVLITEDEQRWVTS